MKKQGMKKHGSKRKKGGSPLTFLFIALVLVISAFVLLRFSGIGAAPGSDSFKRMLGSTQLMQNAKLVKQDLKDIAYEMKDNDTVQMEYSSRKLDADVAVLKEYLSSPVWTVAELVPVLGQDVKTGKALVEISEVFSGDLLKSWIDLQEKAPYTELKTDDGYNEEMVRLYLDYLGDNLPTVRGMVERLDKLNLRLVDDDGKITAVLKQVTPLIVFADTHYADALRPGAEFLLTHRPSELKTDSGFNLEMINAYYDYFLQNLPALKAAAGEVSGLDLSLADKDGKLTAYAQLAPALVDLAERYSETLLTPGLETLSAHPLSEINTDDGLNYDELGVWSDFLLDKSSVMDSFVKELRGLDFAPIGKAEKVEPYLSAAEQLLQVGVPANEKLLRPALQLLKDKPLSSIKVDGGYDVRVILAYLDFAEQNYDLVSSLADQVKTMDLSAIDRSGKAEKYINKLLELRDLFAAYKQYIPAVRVVLGDGQTDRLYFFPAQNAAEIRASGGFPGNAATITVTDGVLKIGNFKSGYSFFTSRTPGRAKITPQEARIFTARMYAPRDVDFCIDWERVASIWAMSVHDEKQLDVDGVITATPVFVQKILTAFDEPIVLSNGMKLDGTTATRVLQRDLYFEYKRAGMNVYPEEDMTDILFAETISKTLDLISSHFDAKHVLDYVRILLDCIDERIIMLWMQDPEEQEIMREVNWSGSLNFDPEDPKLGLFFSSEQSSKMGYFFDMIPEVGEPVVNDDNSRTYSVKLTLNNVITKEEQRIGGTWILGRYYIGSIVGDLTMTAPAGGTISDVKLSIPRGMREETYNGLDTHYVQWLIIERNSPITVTFKVTTAPNVEAPLRIMATPTCTDYRS